VSETALVELKGGRVSPWEEALRPFMALTVRRAALLATQYLPGYHYRGVLCVPAGATSALDAFGLMDAEAGWALRTRTSTRPTLNRLTESMCLYEHSP
jgi:hypothetical protein